MMAGKFTRKVGDQVRAKDEENDFQLVLKKSAKTKRRIGITVYSAPEPEARAVAQCSSGKVQYRIYNLNLNLYCLSLIHI